jgi:ferric-dicitrate binding protein FerR (iron transport regulator)
VFTRLTAGEAMPPRERVWRPARTPSASPATVSGGQEAARSWRRRRTVWRLVALALAIGFLALAFVPNHGVGKGTNRGASKSMCTATGTAACRQAPALPPGRRA